MSEFANLHAHTEFTMSDGCQTVDGYLDRLDELGIERAAITDTHNLFGAVEFHEKALNRGIQPIIGVDLRIRGFNGRGGTGRPRLRVLIENETGYRTLSELLSESYLNRREHGLSVDWNRLIEHSNGLFFLGPPGPGPEQPPPGADLLVSNLDQMLEDVPDSERFYFELPIYASLESRELNLLDAAGDRGVQTIVTHPSYFSRPHDREILPVRMAVQSNRKLQEVPEPPEHRTHQWLAGPEELSGWLDGRDELLERTVDLAGRCHFEFDTHSVHLPRFPDGDNPGEKIRQRCEQRLEEDPVEADEEVVRERLDRELQVIERLGYADYFLIVADMIAWARDQGIHVGPGRGSAAGSLVAYLLDITRVDPMRFDLLFERFLNPERGEMPDIDVDFADHRRDEVIEYLRDRYGDESVGHIITFGKMKARNSLRDVGRVRGESRKDRDRFASLIPAGSDRSLRNLREELDDLDEFVSSRPEREEWFRQAVQLEGLVRNASQHAAGILVVPGRLARHMPLYFPDGENPQASSQFDMYAVEDLGYLKLDVLGLKTLTLLDRTLEEIDPENRPDLEELPEPDETTSRWFRDGSLEGIFQLETQGSRDLVRAIGPETLEDLTDCIALYRPGPLQSGIVDQYRARREGAQPIEYPHPDLEPILEDSFGLIIYQEQVMAIARRIGGLSWADSDRLRRAMGKKKSGLMNQYRQQFVEGAVENGYEKSWADDLFDTLANFAQYGFNRSHSAAYARITYQTAYLKAHHTAEFYAGLLSIRADNRDRVARIVRAMREDGIPMVPPDVNRSPADFASENGSVRFGLRALKHVGSGLAETIESERENSPYDSMEDFLSRIPSSLLRPDNVRSLAAAGAFDPLCPDRDTLIEGAEGLVQTGKRLYSEEQSGQGSLLAGQESRSPVEQLPEADWSEARLERAEKQALGFTLRGDERPGLDEFELWTVPGEPSELNNYVADWCPPAPQLLVPGESIRLIDGNTLVFDVDAPPVALNTTYPDGNKPMVLITLKQKEGAFSAEIIEPVSNTDQLGIELRVGEDQSPETVDRLAEMIRTHPGSTPVRLRLEQKSGSVLLRLNERVEPSTQLCERIHNQLSRYSTRLYVEPD